MQTPRDLDDDEAENPLGCVLALAVGLLVIWGMVALWRSGAIGRAISLGFVAADVAALIGAALWTARE